MKRNIKTNTCLTECVAYYFRLNPERVPFFIGHKDWIRRIKQFFRRRGFNIMFLKYTNSLRRHIGKHGKDKLAIVTGPSWRSKKKRFDHAVVYRGNSEIFDPSYSQKHRKKFLKKAEFYWVISKIK